MTYGVRVVALVLLVVTASVGGVVTVAGGSETVTAVGLSDESINTGVNTTAIAYGVDSGATITFQLDTDVDGTVDVTKNATDEDGDGVVRWTFDPSAYKQGQGTFWVSVRDDPASSLGEVDDTRPETAVTVSNPQGQDIHVNVSTWDGLANEWERLQHLNVSITGPKNATLTRADFTETQQRGQNRSFYTATVNLSTDGEYRITVTNATDRAGNAESDPTNTTASLIVDTEKPAVWNGASVDTDNRNGLVEDGDRVVVSANVTDEFLRGVWVNATAFGAGNVSLRQVDGSHYRGNFTVDAAAAAADGPHELVVRADDAGDNRNATSAGTLTLDTTAPAFANPTPSPGAYINDSTRNVTLDIADAHRVNGSIAIIDATGEVLNGTFADATGVTYQDGTLRVDTATAVGSDGFADGTVTVNVTAHDPEANADTTEWSFVVDTVTPTIGNTSVADSGDGIVGLGENVTVTAAVTDANLLNDSVTLDAGPIGPSALQMERVSGTDRYTATFTVATDLRVDAERVPLTVSAEDRANNTNTTVAGTVTLDSLAPRITDTTPDAAFTNDPTTDFTADVNETHLDEVRVVVANESGATFIDQTVSPAAPTSRNVTLTGGNATGWHVVADPGALPDGNVTATFTARDVTGNATEAAVTTVVDTHRPGFRDVTLADENANGYVGDGEQVTVDFGLAERYPDVAWADASRFGAGARNLSGGPYTWTFTADPAAAADGKTVAVRLNATDRAGNANLTTTRSLTVDLTAPRFHDPTPSNTVVTTDQPTVTVNVTNARNALDTGSVTATFRDADGTTTLTTADTGVTFVTWPGTTNGTFVVNATAADVSFADGLVNVTVRAADVDSNRNRTSFTFRVSTASGSSASFSGSGTGGDGGGGGAGSSAVAIRSTSTAIASPTPTPTSTPTSTPTPSSTPTNATALGVDSSPEPTATPTPAVRSGGMVTDTPTETATPLTLLRRSGMLGAVPWFVAVLLVVLLAYALWRYRRRARENEMERL